MTPRKSLVAAMVIAACLVVPSVVLAANVYVTFCFMLDTDYNDLTDGDYWIEDDNRIGFGIWARVIRNQDGQTMFDGWTSWATGCTTSLLLDTTKTYLVRLYSVSRDANTNYVRVYQGYEGTNYHSQAVDWAYTPPPNNVVEFYTYQIVGMTHETNVLAAAGFALRENNAGLSSRSFYFYGETPDGGGAYTSNGVVWLDQVCKDAKTGTTHELGHVVGYMRNGDQGALHDYSDSGFGNCLSAPNKHDIDSREWQTGAAVEGNAHFYVAVTWNDDSQDDCEFRGFDCEGGTNFQNDWLSQCYGFLSNKGNELDWLRFWWDLHTNGSVSVMNIFGIWDGANPND